MPLPPPLSEEQRRQALEKAAIARRKRAELKEQLKSGRTSLKELLDRTHDEIVGKMKVSTVLESLPGVGTACRPRKMMERLDISESREDAWPGLEAEGEPARGALSQIAPAATTATFGARKADERHLSVSMSTRRGRIFVISGPSGGSRGPWWRVC